MDRQGLATNAFDRYTNLKKAYIGINLMYLQVGKQLKWFKDKDRFKIIGGSDTSWTQFISELAIGRQHSYDLISLYEIFVEKWNIPMEVLGDVDRRKLIATMPLVRLSDSEEYVLEKVYQAKELSRSDLAIALKQEKVGEHEHEWETISFIRCKLCGLKENVKEVQAENTEGCDRHTLQEII